MTDKSYYLKGRRVTLIGLLCNAALFALNLTVGIYGKSQALLAAAVDSASDVATDVMVLLGFKFSNRPRDESHPYGHERIETLFTLILGGVLIYVALKIGFNAGKSIYLHEARAPRIAAAVVAAVAVATKEVLFRYAFKVGQIIRSQSLIANAWHYRSDAFSSVAVLIGVSAASFFPPLQILDAFAALIVAFLIVKVGFEVGFRAARGLVDTAARREVREKIASVIGRVQGVQSIHYLNTRYFGRYILADVHIEVDSNISVFEGHNIATRVKEEVISAIPEVMNLLVHVEPSGDYRANQGR